jgi:hypothetical protein
MKFWLQSLSENGFDVFTLVYIAVLLIVYHYLLRWYINIKFENTNKQIDIINETLNNVLDELEDR